ncbi:MAG: tripartite tricarboxylate transporter substrate binding protein, partial [Verrucomicrobiae bacterium]|nr:tripartite tricarboxylate transporter substrate binding protein [Verrucomicrobiae bacterium]
MPVSAKNVFIHGSVLVSLVFLFYQYFLESSAKLGSYPAKPVKVIVPYDPGGGTDTFARIIQKGIKDNDLMPQPFVIVNKPGGGTTIGSGYVHDSRNDGYTMLCLHEAIMTAYATGQSPYGPDSFEAVADTGEIIQILLVPNGSPFQTFEDFMEKAVREPESIKLGVTLGMPTHFTGLMLEDVVPGARFRFVSSGGGAARLAALMGGHVDASFFSVSEYIRFRENGLRPLVTFGDARHPGAPDVPTARELGIDVTNTNLQYWWFPKGTKPERIDYMVEIFRRAMETDYVQARLAELSILPQIIVGEELRQRIDSRMKAFIRMNVQERIELPNVPLWTLGAMTLFGSIMVVRSIRRRTGLTNETETLALRFDLVWKTLLLA